MPGNPLNLDLPTVGATEGPEYATKVYAAFIAISDDLEAKVTPDEISVNADFSLMASGTSYGLTDADRIRFTEKGSLPGATITGSLFAYDDELYFQDGSGTNVKMTTGGAVAGAAGNVSTTGSPAYATSGVEILWSGGDTEYRFKDGPGATDFASVVFADAEFRQGAFTMTMSSLVTTDYAVIYPATAPGSQVIQQIDGSGNVTFSNTIATAATFSAGLSCATNQDVTLAGTGSVKHGSYNAVIPCSAGQGWNQSTGAYVRPNSLSYSTWTASAATCEWTVHLDLKVGKTIESVSIVWNPHGSAGTKNFRFVEQDIGLVVPAITLVSSTSTATSVAELAVLSSDTVVQSDQTYMLHFTGAGGGEELVAVKVTYKEA